MRCSLTANTAQFDASIKGSARNMRMLQDSAKSTKAGVEEFSGHLENSRGAISVFSGVTGIAAGEMRHFVHAIELAPGPVGAAIAAILVLKAIMDSQAEAAEKAAKANKQYLDSLKADRLKESGQKLSPVGEQLEHSAERVAALRDQIKDIQSPTGGIFTQAWRAFSDPNLKLTKARLSELQSQLSDETKRDNAIRFGKNGQTKSALESANSLSGSTHAQEIGSRIGVFAIEHGENQIELLKQIAQNTGKMTQVNPVSNQGH